MRLCKSPLLLHSFQGFRSDSCLSYNTGLRTQIIMVAVGMFFAIVQDVIYIVHNRRVRSGKHQTKDGSPPYIYTP